MTNRLTANLVIGLALSGMAAGCTVHTYSARPQYPSTAYASHEPARYEGAFRTERRSHKTKTYRPESYRPAHANVGAPDSSPKDLRKPDTSERASAARDKTIAQKPRPTTKPSSKPSRPRHEVAQLEPREHETHKRDNDRVELMPAKPEKAQPRTRSKLLTFHERVEKLVENANEEVAQREKERSKRMNSVIGAAANRND